MGSHVSVHVHVHVSQPENSYQTYIILTTEHTHRKLHLVHSFQFKSIQSNPMLKLHYISCTYLTESQWCRYEKWCMACLNCPPCSPTQHNTVRYNTVQLKNRQDEITLKLIGQDRIGQDRIGQDRIGQDRIGQDRMNRIG